MQSRYNQVNFLQNHHSRKGEIWGVFCSFELSFIFSLSHFSDVGNIMLHWTVL